MSRPLPLCITYVVSGLLFPAGIHTVQARTTDGNIFSPWDATTLWQLPGRQRHGARRAGRQHHSHRLAPCRRVAGRKNDTELPGSVSTWPRLSDTIF